MREKFYHEILTKLDQLSAGMPDKAADSPKLDNQTIASEIITDQKDEIEELKLKLQETEELRDLYYNQKSVAMMQLDIINFVSHIYSEETLAFIYGIVKSAYKHQIEEEQEGENDGEV